MIIATHYEKYKSRSSCVKVAAEGTHSLDDPEAYKSDVNVTERYRNVCTVSARETSQLIDRACRHAREVSGRAVRKDAVRMVSGVTTVPSSWSDSEAVAFFRRVHTAHNAVLKEAGWDASYDAGYAIHFDEKNPHMHEYVVPMTKDGRLSAKKLFDRTLLSEIQKADWKVYQDFAKEHPELPKMESYTHGSKGKHKSSVQMKIEDAVAETEKENVALKRENKALRDENEQLGIAVRHKREKAVSAEKEAKEAKADVEDYKLLYTASLRIVGLLLRALERLLPHEKCLKALKAVRSKVEKRYGALFEQKEYTEGTTLFQALEDSGISDMIEKEERAKKRDFYDDYER